MVEDLKTILRRLPFLLRIFLPNLKIRQIAKIIRFCFDAAFLNKKNPGAIILGLTYACQCKCVHCSVAAYPVNKGGELTARELKALIDEIGQLNIPQIKFFGGEPLLREGLIDLVSYASGQGIITSVDTNGLLLTREKTRELKRAGLNFINISFDSPQADKHNRLRGIDDLFEKCLAATEYCLAEKLPYIISTYASKESVKNGDLEKMIKIGKQNKAAGVKVLLPILSGKWQNSEEILLSQEEEKKVMELTDSNFVYLESPLFSVIAGKKVCESAHKKMVYVSPYGDLQPCYAIPIAFGNIRTGNLSKLLEMMWKDSLFTSLPLDSCVMNDKKFRDRYLESFNKASSLPASASDLFKDAYKISH